MLHKSIHHAQLMYYQILRIVNIMLNVHVQVSYISTKLNQSDRITVTVHVRVWLAAWQRMVLASIPVENVCFQSNYNWANGQAVFSQGAV